MINCSPQRCSWLVDMGFNSHPDFFESLNDLYSGHDISNRYLIQPHICNPKNLWSTIQWLLKRGCRFHPIISELLVNSGKEKWCRWYVSDGGHFTTDCYNLAVTSGSLTLLNLIWQTDPWIVSPLGCDMEDLIVRLVKRGSLTCIKWFEDMGISFKICSRKIVAALNDNSNTKIWY